jgi:hypothetical protein
MPSLPELPNDRELCSASFFPESHQSIMKADGETLSKTGVAQLHPEHSFIRVNHSVES